MHEICTFFVLNALAGSPKNRKLIRFVIHTALLIVAFPVCAQHSFRSGEELELQIYYGPVNAGRVHTELRVGLSEGRRVYHARAIARSTGLADKLYKVRDVYEGYFDSISMLPVKSIRDISEGKYKKHDEVTYDHENNKAYSLRSGEHEVPSGIMDMTTTFFFIRNIDYDTLAYGQVIDINTFFDDEVFPFDMRYRGREEIKTRGGEYRCIKLVPYVEPGRIFKSEDDMTIWLSDDANHVPVRIRFDLIIGSVKCDLIGYSGLKD